MAQCAWIPPDDPDPSEILQSAVFDRKNGQYAQALQKHLWYHHNALNNPADGQGGVRLSFAIGYWHELGSAYPPAMDAFIGTRNKAEVQVRLADDFQAFRDAAAFNEQLDENPRTVELFLEMARKSEETAYRNYHVAERYLIAEKRYRECNPFLEPEKRMAMVARMCEAERWLGATNSNQPRRTPAVVSLHAINNVLCLIALLVLNDRQTEADQVQATAVQLIDDEHFRESLTEAMAGQFPPGYVS